MPDCLEKIMHSAGIHRFLPAIQLRNARPLMESRAEERSPDLRTYRRNRVHTFVLVQVSDGVSNVDGDVEPLREFQTISAGFWEFRVAKSESQMAE